MFDLSELASSKEEKVIQNKYETNIKRFAYINTLHINYLGFMLLNVIPNSFSTWDLKHVFAFHGVIMGGVYY